MCWGGGGVRGAITKCSTTFSGAVYDDVLCTCFAGIPLSCDVDNEWIYVNGSCFKIFADHRTWHDAK